MSRAHRANPFALGGVVTGKQFAGRVEEISRLRRLATSGARAYLSAPRRYGKTSLLKEAFEAEVLAGRLALVWCDCFPTTSPESFAVRLAASVVQAARRTKLAQWATAVGALFRRLKPTLTVDGQGQVRVNVEMDPATTRGSAGLEDALEAAGRLAASKREPVVLVLDEFQRIADWDANHNAEAILRTFLQHQKKLACVFSGSERRLAQRMLMSRSRPLFKLAVPFPLNRLSSEELRPWLLARFGEGGLALEPRAADEVVRTGAGHPWATQYLSYFVWEEAAAQGASRVTVELVDGALSKALAAADPVFSAEFGNLTPAERRVLAALAREPTPSPTASDYLSRHRLPPKSTVSQALSNLIAEGQVEVDKKVHLPSDPLLAEWIRKL